MEECFKQFDKNQDGALCSAEFGLLCQALFKNKDGLSYELDEERVEEMFAIFNVSGDGKMTLEEFVYCWKTWVIKIVNPKAALVVVDVQNDFIDGDLAIINFPAAQHGKDVLEPINRMIETIPFELVCYTLDWHPEGHVSFLECVHKRKLAPDSPITDPAQCKVYDTVIFEGPPRTTQTLYPTHCIQGSWGSELHKDLKIHPAGRRVYKGDNPDVDSYSAFLNNNKEASTELEGILRSQGITHLFICGIATDVCVASTMLDSLDLGFMSALVQDASRGVSLEGINGALERIQLNHGAVIHTTEVQGVLEGKDRRPDLGYRHALECSKALRCPAENRTSIFSSQVGTDGTGDLKVWELEKKTLSALI